ncbi:hypothetical protein [Kitasatospora sp. NPDC088548]|uniref:hypothetical protein n=1 Tax=Kitasatospora sp. NPDC088548 TaxID=3364075 RepID=UPI00382302C2
MADLSKHQPTAHPVFDPALPADARDAVAELAASCPDLLAENDEARLMASFTGASGILRWSAGAAAVGGIVALAAFLLGTPEDDASGSESLDHQLDGLVRDLLESFENIGLLLFVGGALAATMAIILSVAENRRIDRFLDQARGHYVHPRWLTDDAALLLARAQQAAATVLDSQLCRDDLGGLGTATAVQLPERLWTIADSLRRYSKAAKDCAAAPVEDSAVAELLAGEREVLDKVFAGVEVQVVALEEYALHALKVDRIASDRAVAEQVEARSGAVHDLLAEAAAVPVGVVEIKALTASSAEVAEAYTAALGAARAAAAAALPTVDNG